MYIYIYIFICIYLHSHLGSSRLGQEKQISVMGSGASFSGFASICIDLSSEEELRAALGGLSVHQREQIHEFMEINPDKDASALTYHAVRYVTVRCGTVCTVCTDRSVEYVQIVRYVCT